jgi:hypothetical protein
LSTQGPLAAAAAAGPRRAPPDRGASPRRRGALVACALLVLALHAALLGQVGGLVAGAPEASPAAISVRAIAAVVEKEGPAEVAETAAAVPPAARVTPSPRPRPPRRSREPSIAKPSDEVVSERVSAGSDALTASPASAPAVADAAPMEAPAASTPVLAAAIAGSASSASPPMAESAPTTLAASAAAPSFLAAGELPPPTYRTRLAPAATLRYQVRRGFLRGTGEIRWRPLGDSYQLVLEARIAGLTLLVQTSEGGIDATGLAPVRFVDQRARRAAQAANFRRDAGTITFSGPGVEWPLLAGSQDRLSWMVQLAGIAAAEPELLVEGGRITMVVVGARGEASVWTLRSAGVESVETAVGMVRAVKLVREGKSAYDSGAEIWLDPERDFLPAHATLRNSAGGSEYDLLLERVEPAP